MPAYQFTAIDASGKQQKGVLEGDSARQIRQQLRDKALIPVTVDPVEQKDKHRSERWLQKKVTAYDLALFTRQLSVLVAAAIPLEEALRAVGKQSEKVHVQNLLMSVRSKVMEGHSLANALQQAGRLPDLYIATIAAGERSGHLDLILDQLSDYTENRFAMQKKVQGAMIYPIILMLMSFAIVMGLMTYVVLFLFGFENARVWGLLAGILHIIPYLGTLLTAAGVFVTGLQQWSDLSMAGMAAGTVFLVASVIGTFAQTWILGKIVNINHTAQFVALLFFGWLWGAVGLLIAMPLLVVIKVIASRIDGLDAVAHFLKD